MLAERTERMRLLVGSDVLCTGIQGALAVLAAASGPVGLAIALAALTTVRERRLQPGRRRAHPLDGRGGQLVAANALDGPIQNLVVASGPLSGRWCC